MNTFSFHAMMVQRQQKNRLVGLEDERGRWREGTMLFKRLQLNIFRKFLHLRGISHVC